MADAPDYVPEFLKYNLADYIESQRQIGDKVAAMQSPSSAFQQPELGSKFTEGAGPSVGGPDVKGLDSMPSIKAEMSSAGIEQGPELSTGLKASESDGGISGDVGGAAIMAGASALKGIMKAKAEKEALEFQKKREMTQKQSEAQQKTAARGMGAGVQNMQQLIANFRSAAR